MFLSLYTHIYKNDRAEAPVLPHQPPLQVGLSFLLRWQPQWAYTASLGPVSLCVW